MAAFPPRTYEEIEAQIREIQARKANVPVEPEEYGEGVPLAANTGICMNEDIYGGSKSKYEGYETSVAANDDANVDAQEDKDKPNSTMQDSGSDKEEKPQGSPNGMQPKAISRPQEELIRIIVARQEEFESLSEDDFKKITAIPLGDSEEDSLKRYLHIAEITFLDFQLIVEFCNCVPGFDILCREDQITLLKACSSEVMILRIARKYDIKTDSIVFSNNQRYTRENFRSAFMEDSADYIFNFCRNMCVLKVDSAEYALLMVIVAFSERPSLLEPQRVKKLQEFCIGTLRAYISTYRPLRKNYFTRLLSTLAELHTLSNMNSELCFHKIQNKKFHAFLEDSESAVIQHNRLKIRRPNLGLYRRVYP